MITLSLFQTKKCVVALGEESEKVIRFRDLEWGASYTELEEQLELDFLKHLDISYSTDYLLYKGENRFNDSTVCVSCAYSQDAIKSIGLVAGHRINYILLFFVYTADEDGALPRDADHTALYAARYRLDGNMDKAERQAVFDDLTFKLSGLYGDVDLTTDTVNVFYGADGTKVSVKNDPADTDLYITYTSGNGDALIEAAVLGNVDGL